MATALCWVPVSETPLLRQGCQQLLVPGTQLVRWVVTRTRGIVDNATRDLPPAETLEPKRVVDRSLDNVDFSAQHAPRSRGSLRDEGRTSESISVERLGARETLQR